MKSLNLGNSAKQKKLTQEKTIQPKIGRVKKTKEKSFFCKISALRRRKGISRAESIRNNTFGRRRFINFCVLIVCYLMTNGDSK